MATGKIKAAVSVEKEIPGELAGLGWDLSSDVAVYESFVFEMSMLDLLFSLELNIV
jgi:hypothetical protein